MSGLIKVVRKAKPFFSRVDEAAKELPRTKGTGKEFMAELKKQPGVKKAELDDRKLSELESAPKMTKEEFIQKLEQKPAPKIEESIKANPTDADLDEMAMKLIDDKADELTERKLGKRDRFNRYDWDDYKEGAIQYLKDYDYDKYLREAKRNIEENVGADFPKYQDYKLPGGENYREILLKLPNISGKKQWTIKAGEAGSQQWEKTFKSEAEFNDYVKGLQNEGILYKVKQSGVDAPAYQSKHWDEPNVLAHIRVQDRVGPNGEKILHVEEIQSDWHQEGRKHGYELNSEKQKEQFAGWPGVPDAPFKKNWHELATKRIMDYAIQNGYDKVAITPGAEQASRYNLSTHIDNMMIGDEHNGTRQISWRPKNSQAEQALKFDKEGNVTQSMLSGLQGKNITEVFGKDLAEKIMQSKPYERIEGVGLDVGGEGMIGFYDQILPAYINKEYGKYGANVGKYDITSAPQNSMEVEGYVLGPEYISGRANWADLLEANPDLASKYKTQLHSIDITPEMRETIQSKGQPLYQATGIGLTGAAAAPSEEKVQISDNPDTMMLELQDQGFAGGGLLKKAVKAIKGTQEALPAAEREANLAKFLEQSQIKNQLYRGQRRVPKPDKFITTQSRATPSFTDDPEVANVYSQQLGWDIAHGPGSTSVPVYVQMEKPLDIRDLGEHITLEEFLGRLNHDLNVPRSPDKIGYEDLSDILGTLDYHVYKGGAKHKIDASDKRGLSRIKSFEQLADEVYDAGRNKNIDKILYELLSDSSVDTYALADSREVVKQLKKLGYDSMIHKDVFDAGMPYYKGDPNKIGEGFDADHIIDAYRPFEQTKIKSAIGNRGTYDVTDPDITKAVGGLARVKRK